MSNKAFPVLAAWLCLSTPALARNDEFLPVDAPLPKDAMVIPMTAFSFDKDVAGKPPAGFRSLRAGDSASARWEVTADRRAPSVPHTVVQRESLNSGEHFTWLLLEHPPIAFGEIAVRFKTLSSDDDQSASLVFQLQDDKNFCVLILSTRHDSCALYRVRDGKKKLMDEAQGIIAPLTWHDIRLIFTADRATVLLNNQLLLGSKYKGFKTPGSVGFGVQSNSSVAFDDFRVSK